MCFGLCALILVVHLLLYFTGGSSRHEKGVVRKAKGPAKKKSDLKPTPSISKKRKSKELRQNYRDMNSVDFALMRQKDWYKKPRDEEIEDLKFWCMEQFYVHKDIYLSYKNPNRPMHPIKLAALTSKPKFSHGVNVVEQFGLVTLMEKQCGYNVPLVVQFFATLVIEDDDVKTLKWMSNTTFCMSTFKKFGTILGYGFRGHPPSWPPSALN